MGLYETKPKKEFMKLLLILLSFFVSLDLFAKLPKESLQVPELVAIQNRSNYLDSDLSFYLGWLPSDSFYKGVTLGLSYTKFFNQYKAWEIINVQGNLSYETSLKSEFDNLDVDIENSSLEGKIEPITYIVTSSYVYTPFYSKSLLFNQSLVNSETSFILGVGTVKFRSTQAQPLISLGAYSRYYTDIGRSWKLEVKWNFHRDSDGYIGNYAFVGLAYSMQLGTPPKYLIQKERIDD